MMALNMNDSKETLNEMCRSLKTFSGADFSLFRFEIVKISHETVG